MNNLDNIYEKLNTIQEQFGYAGVLLGLFLLIIGFLTWFYLRSFIENLSKSFFENSLSKYKAELVKIIGENFMIQNGEIQKNIAELKSNLQLITHQETNFLNEKRKSLVDFYSNHINWTRTILSKAPLELDQENVDYQYIIFSDINKASHNFNLSLGKLQIYVNDEELKPVISNLLVLTTKLQNNKQEGMLKYWFKLKETKRLDKLLFSLTTETIHESKELIEKLEKLDEESLELVSEFTKDEIEIYSQIAKIQQNATLIISGLIKSSFEKSEN